MTVIQFPVRQGPPNEHIAAELPAEDQYAALKSTYAPHRRLPKRAAGYLPRSPKVYRIYNVCLAFVAIIALSPILLTMTLIGSATKGRGFVERVPTLGFDGQVFQRLKFAESGGSGVEAILQKSSFGRQLAGIAQIFNVLRGDMNVVGPHPIDAFGNEAATLQFSDAGSRLSVKPGLFDYADFYMPMRTSFEIKQRLTHQMVQRHVQYRFEFHLFVRLLADVVMNLPRSVGRRSKMRQARRAAHQRDLRVGQRRDRRPVSAIYERTLNAPYDVDTGNVTLAFRHRSGGIRRAKVRLTALHHLSDMQAFSYHPLNNRAEYLIDRYLIEDVTIAPRRVGRVKNTSLSSQ